MYELKESGNGSYTLTEKEYNWMVELLKNKRTGDLKKAMEEYINYYGIAELRSLVKYVTKEQ